MFAVIKTGGKQYRVEEGLVFDIERVEKNPGETLDLEEVLLVSSESETKVGTPFVSGAKVSLEVLSQKRGPKLIIFKKIRRHGKRLKKGHRQELTRVKVKEITA